MIGHPVLRRCAAALCCWLAIAAPLVSGGLLDSKDDDGILPVDEAFRLQPAIWEKGRLALRWDVAPGCYLYRDKLSLELLEPAGPAAGTWTLPAGSVHRDEHFGEVRILRGTVPAQWQPAENTIPRKVRVRYQGCAEGKVCYQPQVRELQVLNLSQ